MKNRESLTRTSIIWGIMISMVLFSMSVLSCSKQKKCSSTQPEEFPEYFRPPNGAKDISYDTSQAPDIILLYYRMKDSYPANRTLTYAASLLEDGGFKRLDYDLLNPDIPSSHIRGWDHIGDHSISPPVDIRLWSENWVNSKDEVVSTNFEYRYPQSGPKDLDNLQVTLFFYSPTSWIGNELKEYRKIHPTFNPISQNGFD